MKLIPRKKNLAAVCQFRIFCQFFKQVFTSSIMLISGILLNCEYEYEHEKWTWIGTRTR
jgi:hypothetical protein